MRWKTWIILAVGALLASGCAGYSLRQPVFHNVERAVCVLHPVGGSHVTGLVTFSKREGYVLVNAAIHGLTPGKHGFHIHEYGDCSSPDGKSAGGHFNPGNTPHGAPNTPKSHAGDLGNVTAGANGDAHLELKALMIQLQGPQTIIGRGIIIHAGEDDLHTQPTGNAGARVACGVIGIANPNTGMARAPQP